MIHSQLEKVIVVNDKPPQSGANRLVAKRGGDSRVQDRELRVDPCLERMGSQQPVQNS